MIYLHIWDIVDGLLLQLDVLDRYTLIVLVPLEQQISVWSLLRGNHQVWTMAKDVENLGTPAL